MSFQGQVAIVTGAASGIGRSIAGLFAREEASIVLSDVSQEKGEQTAFELRRSGAEAVFVLADASRAEDSERLVSEAVQRYGRLDFACNNAGVSGAMNPTAEYPLESWERVIGVNLSGVFYGMKYQIPAMLKSGGGSIVNITSILGQVAFANSCAYVSAKHGVNGLTKCAAVEYASQAIRVNAVGPGFIKTPLLGALEADPAVMNHIVSLHPIGRLGTPEEVAELVIWLSSPKASFVTGAYYPVDGGYLAV